MLHKNSYKLIQACDWLTALLPAVMKSVKCKHQKMSKDTTCPPHPTQLKLKSWGWTGKAMFFHTGRSNCKWLLLHNSALLWLENLHQFSNWCNNFRLDAISHKFFMWILIFCRRLVGSDITVTPSVKCMDCLHRWYNHAAHLVSSSTTMDILNNTSEKHKSTSPVAFQVKNCFNTVGTGEKLDAISWLKEGWMKCYIYCNVTLAHSSILTVCDNAGRIKQRAWYETEVFV